MSNDLENFTNEHREDFDSYEPGSRVWKGIEKKLPQRVSPLEQFVQNNREDFDSYEPRQKVWTNIEKQLPVNNNPQTGILKKMTWMRWSAAASVIIMLVAGLYYFSSNTTKQIEVAVTKPHTVNADSKIEPAKENTVTTAPGNTDTPKNTINPGNDQQTMAGNTTKDDSNEELVHYTRLIEIKQNQIKRLRKDEPLLYQEFAGDFNKLDSTFHTLKKQLPVNPNREQILEAMIQNLQLQTALLNQQLNIIKQINQSKKSAYEKAYKTI